MGENERMHEIVLAESQQLETNSRKMVLTDSGYKVLRVSPLLEDMDYEGILDRVAQYVNIGSVLDTIQKGTEYVVQIPMQYRTMYASGEYFINKNKTTGIEWPSLVTIGEDGRYKFVDNLPIKQQEFTQGNPFQDIAGSFHNIYMQKQIVALAEAVAETYVVVRRIEQGQNDDRLALIDAGREEILLAMCLENENERSEHIRLGRNNLLLGKEQIGKALKRRVEEFEAIPENPIMRFLLSAKYSDYLSKKDEEVEHIQECYEMYMEATKMLAASFAYVGEYAAVEQTFKASTTFLGSIDFKSVKTIEYAHRRTDLSDMFFNNAVGYVEAEKGQFLESARSYDYIAIEVSGEQLLGIVDNGR